MDFVQNSDEATAYYVLLVAEYGAVVWMNIKFMLYKE